MLAECGIRLALETMTLMNASDTRLRYLDASHVETPIGNLSCATVVDEHDRPLGRLDGVLIDPAGRQVRYFILEARGWIRSHHYLLVAMPMRIEPDPKVLRVIGETGDVEHLPEVEPESFPPFSDADLIDAIFSHHAA